MSKVVISFLFCLSVFFSWAYADAINISGESTTRIRFSETSSDTDTRSRLQENIILQLEAEVGGGWKLIGVLSNGDKFNSQFDNLYDSNDENEFDQAANVLSNFSLRNIYLRNQISQSTTIEMGSLQTRRGLQRINALEKSGWIDGVRVLHESDSLGLISFTAGSIEDTQETSVFSRDLDLNYIEVKLRKEIFQNLLTEVGFEKYNDDHFLALASEYEIEIASGKVLTVIAESLIEIETHEHKSSIGVRANLSDLFEKVPLNMRVEFRHNKMSTRDVDRFRLLPGGFWSPNQPGEYATFVLRGDFEVKGESRFARFMQETSWSFRVRHEYVTNDNRIEFNFTKKF